MGAENRLIKTDTLRSQMLAKSNDRFEQNRESSHRAQLSNSAYSAIGRCFLGTGPSRYACNPPILAIAVNVGDCPKSGRDETIAENGEALFKVGKRLTQAMLESSPQSGRRVGA